MYLSYIFLIILWYIYDNSIIWYLNILINNFIFFYCLEQKINILKSLYKFIFFNYYFFIKKSIINFFNYNINLKFLLYFKFNIQIFCKYFFKYLQNINNNIIYFKSNYYFFKKQRLLRKRKRYVPLLSLLSTNLKRNWFSLKMRSSNFFVFHNLYLLNTLNLYIPEKNINLSNIFLICMNLIPFFKERLFNFSNMFILLYFIYILYFIIMYFIQKKYNKIYFFSKIYYNKDFNFVLKEKKNKNVFNFLSKLDKKNLYIYKFFLSNLNKKLNILNIFYNKKYLWLKKIFNYKKYLTLSSFDQFQKIKPIYKSLCFFYSFINIKNLDSYMKAYMKFFLIKKFPFKKILNDFFSFLEFDVKKENIKFKYKSLTYYVYFNFLFFYWILLIPYFILNYILIKYHLKLYVKIRRRFIIYLKSYLDNIKLFVKINKYIGRVFFKSMYRSKRFKDSNIVFLFRKRAKKSHFGSHSIRYRKLYYRISPLGSFYYWFSKIDIIKYIISFKNYFFKSAIKSMYYYWLIIIYWFFILYWFKKFNINKFLKKFIYIKFFKSI